MIAAGSGKPFPATLEFVVQLMAGFILRFALPALGALLVLSWVIHCAFSQPVAAVRAKVETTPVPSAGDAADDIAIWVHPADPARSAVIATDKDSGLLVYDLDGTVLQYVQIGEINNVDLRDGFRLGGRQVTLVVGSNRADNTFIIYVLDPATRRLEPAGTRPVLVGLEDAYGLCLYHSAASGQFYVFVTSTGNGGVEQWELYATGGGIAARQVRSFAVGSDTEGCVADDTYGRLYLSEERRGIWRYGAEPQDGDARVLIDSTGAEGHLASDVEGLALYPAPAGGGYLIASNQGSSTFAVYRRSGDNAYLGDFTILGRQGIDPVTVTDGIDVTSAFLNRHFPRGVLVVQDHRNTAPEANQNFKFVSWRDISRALNLPF